MRKAVVLALTGLMGPLLFSGDAQAQRKIVWNFDEGTGQVFQDAGGKYPGKILNATWDKGKQGAALRFEDYGMLPIKEPSLSQKEAAARRTLATVPHNPDLSPNANLRVQARVRIDAEFLPYYGGIIEKGSGWLAEYRLILICPADQEDPKTKIHHHRFRLRGSVGYVEEAGGATKTGLVSADGKTVLQAGEWYDLGMAYDGQTLTLYVNGQEDGKVEQKVKLNRGKSDVRIGDRFTGLIDEITFELDR